MKNNILFAAFALIICTTQNSWAQNGDGYGHHRDYDDAYRNNQTYGHSPNNAYNNGYNRTYYYSNNGYDNNGYYTQNNVGYNGQEYRQHYRRPCNYYPSAPVVVYQNRARYCPPPPMMHRPRVNINIRF